MRAMIGTVLLSSLLAAPTWAAEPTTKREGGLVISKSLIALALQQPPAAAKPGFDAWNGRFELARAKRGKGVRFILIGAAVATVGPLIGAAMISESGTTGGSAFALITTMGGIGTLGYGGWTLYSARQEIEDLDREGRIKGYLTLAPIPGGAQMAARFTF